MRDITSLGARTLQSFVPQGRMASPETSSATTVSDGVTLSGGAASASPRRSPRSLVLAATLMAGLGLASSLSGCAAVAVGTSVVALSEAQDAKRIATQNAQTQPAAGQKGQKGKPQPAQAQPAQDPTLLNSVGSGTHKILQGFGDFGRGIGKAATDGWNQVREGWNTTK